MSDGLYDYDSIEGHIVILSNDNDTVDKVIREVGSDREFIVVSMFKPTSVQGWVKADSFLDRDAMRRAGITRASKIVVMTGSDDENMSASLLINSMITKKLTQVVVYFREPENARLVQENCPNIDCVISNAAQMVSRALADPGAHRVLTALMDSEVGSTLFCEEYDPFNLPPNAIAYQTARGKIHFGPYQHSKGTPTHVFYIAERRRVLNEA